MKAPLKLIFLSLLFLTSTVCLKAQEKYDYAIVKYNTIYTSTKPGLHISISGRQFEYIELNKDAVKDWRNDFSPLLNYVQKMTNDGWKVITAGDYIFILERRRN